MSSSHDAQSGLRRPYQPLLLLHGLLLLALAAIALLEPVVAGFAIGLVLGTLLMTAGALGIVTAVQNRGWRHRWINALVGLVVILMGATMIWNPLLGALTVIWSLGAGFTICAVLELTVVFTLTTRRWRLMLVAATDLALGTYLLIINPRAAITLLAIIVAIGLAVRGVLLASHAVRHAVDAV